jgi:hypothetical protein
MNRNRSIAVVCVIFALAFAGATPQRMQAQEGKNPYPTSMAPLGQYLMDREAEIALARSAAPPPISKDATVLVLGKDGYETAVQGTNGFVCSVDRSWMDQFEDTPEFWNPKRRGPICDNAEAAKTRVPLIMIRTRLALAGKSKAEIKEGLKAAIEKGQVPAREPGGMAFMMSKQGHLSDRDGHWFPHLMFYGSAKDYASKPSETGESTSIFTLIVDKWSDGTPAPPK